MNGPAPERVDNGSLGYRAPSVAFSLTPVSELCWGGHYTSQATRGTNMSLQLNNFNFPPINGGPNTGSKRPRLESNQNSPVNQFYDRFFKITMINGSFKETSPFLLHKALQAKFGSLADIKKAADGSLIIKVSNERQSEIAGKLDKLHDFDVSTIAHKTLNSVKGVITCRDLQYCSDEEIVENLKEQGVSELYRIPQRKENSNPSFTFILTFKLHQLPERIHAGWYSIRVRPHIPPPMRCFVCQTFGHTATKCSKNPVCPSCGHSHHSDSQCTLPPKCVNCNEAHSPRYKGCTKYKIEYDIQKIMTIEKINYFDAKRKYFTQNPALSFSFSDVTKGTKPKLVSTSTQCDLINDTPLPNPSQKSSSTSSSSLSPNKPHNPSISSTPSSNSHPNPSHLP